MRRDVLSAVLPRMLEKRFAFDLELFVIARRLGYKRFLEAPDSASAPVHEHGVLALGLSLVARHHGHLVPPAHPALLRRRPGAGDPRERAAPDRPDRVARQRRHGGRQRRECAERDAAAGFSAGPSGPRGSARGRRAAGGPGERRRWPWRIPERRTRRVARRTRRTGGDVVTCRRSEEGGGNPAPLRVQGPALRPGPPGVDAGAYAGSPGSGAA